MEKRSRVLVVGGGPIGLEAAVLLVRAGFAATVVERGSIADSVRRWGHVRLFSSNALNCSQWGLQAICEDGSAAPDPSEHPTGSEYAEKYLDALHAWLLARPQQAEVLLHTKVEALSRLGVLKNEQVVAVGETARNAAPFCALLATADAGGREILRTDFAAVFDCSGSFGNGCHLGPGGAPAVGELRLRREPRPATPCCWFDSLPDALGADAAAIVGGGGERRLLVLGGGYSAATTLEGLLSLAAAHPHVSFHIRWLLRKPAGAEPYARVADDPLPARALLVDGANSLADGSRALPANVRVSVVRGVEVRELEASEGGEALTVRGETSEGPLELGGNHVLACHVGYRPDMALSRELQLHHCYASEGPMKLAASLLSARVAAQGTGDAGAASDCLKQAAPGPELLKTPEPRFFVLGAKSYGRNSAFLLTLGHAQVEAAVGILAADLLGGEK